MQVFFKIVLLLFSCGILLYPAKTMVTESAEPMECCAHQDNCHNNPFEKKEKKSSQDCCNISATVFQLYKNQTATCVIPILFEIITKKDSFFYPSGKLSNSFLNGIWQPPKFI